MGDVHLKMTKCNTDHPPGVVSVPASGTGWWLWWLRIRRWGDWGSRWWGLLTYNFDTSLYHICDVWCCMFEGWLKSRSYFVQYLHPALNCQVTVTRGRGSATNTPATRSVATGQSSYISSNLFHQSDVLYDKLHQSDIFWDNSCQSDIVEYVPPFGCLI